MLQLNAPLARFSILRLNILTLSRATELDEEELS